MCLLETPIKATKKIIVLQSMHFKKAQHFFAVVFSVLFLFFKKEFKILLWKQNKHTHHISSYMLDS